MTAAGESFLLKIPGGKTGLLNFLMQTQKVLQQYRLNGKLSEVVILLALAIPMNQLNFMPGGLVPGIWTTMDGRVNSSSGGIAISGLQILRAQPVWEIITVM